jgi:hypothetical protein
MNDSLLRCFDLAALNDIVCCGGDSDGDGDGNATNNCYSFSRFPSSY